MSFTNWLLAYALYAASPVVFLVIVAWPRRQVHHHRVSNYLFLRRIRAQQRSRTPGGSTSSDSQTPKYQLSETAGIEPTAGTTSPAAEAPPATLAGAISPPGGRT